MKKRMTCLVAAGAVILAACGGGGETGTLQGTDPTAGCTGSCSNAAVSLTVADVQQVLAQAIHEAQARSQSATIAVVDRVGNVLAVYRMSGATARTVLIASAPDAQGNPGTVGGLEGIRLPVSAPGLQGLHVDDQAAIAKAITGAYLSTEGNAFSTRTASQIIGSHFNPGETGQPSGPLAGVQLSQLACSDFSQRFNGVAPAAGPHRSPLGLAADPGGFPLYKAGTVVGGVGVIADGLYGVDNSTSPEAVDFDEAIAYAATYGFGAPASIRADRISVAGRTLRFSSIDYDALAADPGTAPAYATLDGGVGALVATTGYATASIRAGVAFGQPPSGIRPADAAAFPGQDAFVFVDDADAPRFAPRDGTDGPQALSGAEVTQVLQSALEVANKARGQIRVPLGQTARVTIAVVDSSGGILGMAASRDAPVFGADVSVQKARTASLFSSAGAAGYFGALPPARSLTTDDAGVHVRSQPLGDYVTAMQAFLGKPAALTDGGIAYSGRAIGDLSRPFFPDGIDGAPPGPLAPLTGPWSPFSTGLQLDLSINAVLQHVLHVAGAGVPDVAPGCSGVSLATDLSAVSRVTTDVLLGNGLQIFAGSVPIYRGATLVGAIGVSGDGTQQDDMVAFLGLANASKALNGTLGNAPAARRSDTLTPQGVRLQWVQCPASPFVGSTDQEACGGL